MSEVTFFDPNTGDVSFGKGVFKPRLKARQAMVFLGAEVEETDPEYRAKYPNSEPYRVHFRFRPLSFIPRPRQDGTPRTEIDEYAPLSDALDGKLDKIRKSASTALKIELSSLSHLNRFAGTAFWMREVPMTGSTYQFTRKDGSIGYATTYWRFEEVIPPAEAAQIVPVNRTEAATAPEVVLGGVSADEVVLALVGAGLSQNELINAFLASEHTSNIEASSDIMTGAAVERMLAAGTLVLDGDVLRPVQQGKKAKAA